MCRSPSVLREVQEDSPQPAVPGGSALVFTPCAAVVRALVHRAWIRCPPFHRFACIHRSPLQGPARLKYPQCGHAGGFRPGPRCSAWDGADAARLRSACRFLSAFLLRFASISATLLCMRAMSSTLPGNWSANASAAVLGACKPSSRHASPSGWGAPFDRELLCDATLNSSTRSPTRKKAACDSWTLDSKTSNREQPHCFRTGDLEPSPVCTGSWEQPYGSSKCGHLP